MVNSRRRASIAAVIAVALVFIGPQLVGADTNEAAVGGPYAAGQSSISVGDRQSCALISTGAVKCWGYNIDGALGNGGNSDSNVPDDVSNLSSGVVAITAGSYHSCALLSTGAVKCWGNNVAGQLGNGGNSSRNAPVDVTSLSDVVAISAGLGHSCALLSTGAVKCWGFNLNRQLGDGTTNDRGTPVDVTSLSGVVAISAGGEHSCALLSTGAVKCWGRNSEGQLGDGTTNVSGTPVDVTSLSGVVAISAGGAHSCALLSTGGVKCWGTDVDERLGNGSNSNSNVPIDVSGLSSGAVAISAGSAHSCALLSTGGMKCWGYNSQGQLGNGSTNPTNVPVDVSNLSSGVGITTTTSTTSTSTTITTTAVPVAVRAAATAAPQALAYRAANKKVTLRWRAVEGAASYVVTTTSGTEKCTATTTSCDISKLKNGKAYSYLVYSVNADGVRSETGTKIIARPGFLVKRTSLKVKKTLKLSSIVTSPSKGAKSWRVTSGSCRISGTRLIAPSKAGTCKLRLATAKQGSYPAMTTSIKITVTK